MCKFNVNITNNKITLKHSCLKIKRPIFFASLQRDKVQKKKNKNFKNQKQQKATKKNPVLQIIVELANKQKRNSEAFKN